MTLAFFARLPDLMQKRGKNNKKFNNIIIIGLVVLIFGWFK